MLYLIGLGLKPKHLSLEAQEYIKKCKEVYLEKYTSKYSEGTIKELEELTGKKISGLDRKEVEENSHKLLDRALKENICLLVYGNPLTATTHIQSLVDCKVKGVDFKVFPGISVFDFLGLTGLEQYKFGRTTSVVFSSENYFPESFFDVIESNKKVGLHTLCLLDINAEENKFMSVKESLGILEEIDKKKDKSIISDSVLIALAGLGSKKEKIVVGDAEKLKEAVLDVFPQSLIVCGKLNEKERENLRELHGFRE